MATAANLGFPRMGPRRELKRALEAFWAGKSSETELSAAARGIRAQNWRIQKEAGVASIPSNDFSLYDQVLDASVLAGAIPARYGWERGDADLTTYFAMARGTQDAGRDVVAMEMTKWFDTNYHYIVPEFERGAAFRVASRKPVDEYREAKALGIETRPVLVGPLTFLLLGKAKDPGVRPLSLLDALLPVYEETLRALASAGAAAIQVDEPALVLDLQPEARAAYPRAFERIRRAAGGMKILVATYFGDLGENLEPALRLPVDALHLDLVRAPSQLDAALANAPASLSLSLGVVDGRNIWRTDLERALALAERAASKLGAGRLQIAPSCSLLHVPVDLDLERTLDAELKAWLAFARQKLSEVATLAKAIDAGRAAVKGALDANRDAMERRRTSPRIHDPAVKRRLASVTPEMACRKSPFAARCRLQRERLKLPAFPTTTIGSFPQTAEVRAARADAKAGRKSAAEYEAFLKKQIEHAVRFQERTGLDVLVHGESERNDMVEYFGEQLRGFAFTGNGWVQSYGSRCVKPPVIFGDVARPGAMTVPWARHAQSLTKRPMKGMLTGPVTILQWSFVRDDQPRAETCRQIALALRDEVCDLEAAGISVIQIDEPAIREGLPLRRAEWKGYLEWAVRGFRLASSGVRDETQIHTHMCYSEFGDILEEIAGMDADVITIETSRSQMELLDAFARFRYPNEIGPGVYDIHSPRIPSRQEIEALLRRALAVFPAERLWVNPDCGLKTRRWEEVEPALARMVEAARALRAAVGAKA